MVILGIDPAIKTTGYAVITTEKDSAEVVNFGCIETDRSTSFPLRLKKIYDGLSRIIEQHCPQVLAIEEVFYSQNIQVALKMGHARGVALLAAANYSIPIFEYSPREVKIAVTGNGAASKLQVQKMVVQLLNLSELPSSFDIADALAVALCHYNRKQYD